MLDWLKKDESSTGGTSKTGGPADEGLKPVARVFNKKVALPVYTVPATLGRNGDEADIYFSHESVSRVHCRFDCKNRQLTITDLGSTVGTQVNGTKIAPGEPVGVNTGDKLVIGKIKFDIRIDYEEIERREQEALRALEEKAKPKEKIHIVHAREVSPYEYEEIEVVYVSCGLEPEKKKAKYTQEISASEIRDAMKAAEQPPQKSSPDAAAPFVSPKVPEPVVEPEPVVIPKPVVEPEPVVIPKPVVEPEPRVIPKPVIEPDSLYEPEPRVIPKPVVESDPEYVLCLSHLDSETGTAEEIMIDHFPFRIGRKRENNDYVLKLDGISRKHIIITENEGIYYVTDLGSTNGTKVNGVKIAAESEYRISPGDTIKLSKRVYTVGMVEKK